MHHVFVQKFLQKSVQRFFRGNQWNFYREFSKDSLKYTSINTFKDFNSYFSSNVLRNFCRNTSNNFSFFFFLGIPFTIPSGILLCRYPAETFPEIKTWIFSGILERISSKTRTETRMKFLEGLLQAFFKSFYSGIPRKILPEITSKF